jgi:hypothetical protein
MFMKTLGITSTALSIAAFATLSGGCVSVHRTPTRTVESRHDNTVVASRHNTPSYDQQIRSRNGDRQRVVQAPTAQSQVRSESPRQPQDPRNERVADTRLDTGLTAAERVTVVSAEAPPLSRAETPSHTANANEFWVAGHWVVDANAFAWRPGRIEHDRAGALFSPAGWADSPRGWEFTPEYWR